MKASRQYESALRSDHLPAATAIDLWHPNESPDDFVHWRIFTGWAYHQEEDGLAGVRSVAGRLTDGPAEVPCLAAS